MATVLQPIVNELNTVLVQLRTELRGLQTDADGAGIAIAAHLNPTADRILSMYLEYVFFTVESGLVRSALLCLDRTFEYLTSTRSCSVVYVNHDVHTSNLPFPCVVERLASGLEDKHLWFEFRPLVPDAP